MKKYEKLILLLEQEGVDVSPFVNIKKNEIASEGCVDVLSLTNYHDIIDNKQRLHDSSLKQSNPFFLALKKETRPKYVGDMKMRLDDSLITFEDVFNDESKTETDKHTIAYKGFQQLSNEYRVFVREIVNNEMHSVKQFKKVHKNVLVQDLRESVKKHIKLFWFLDVLLILLNFIFIKGTHLEGYRFFSIFYNIILNLLLIAPFFKLWYHQVLLNKLVSEDKDFGKLKEQCNELIDLNDQLISRLENDLYAYSNNSSKKKRIRYLGKSKRKMMWIRFNVKRILKHQNRKKTIMYNVMNGLNKGLLLSVLLLIIIFLILI
ncbi:hypothetical protein [Haloplasma contractile]|uniref:Uncharacterized protein n=1 Tax=Haloplasma contractile SSD-17B TaxID=1033810 RepID=U2EA35_9MOLU|nr:hypothetical protein [Haloplasma contractile]ERJ11978.1 hypothetical protein HLPCO_001892 [Haloplasma contractile SSD-17B]